jgi:hypothetical protein
MTAPTVKSFESVEVKDADLGLIEAVIATLGVVDRDRDIIRKDAIKSGSKVMVSSYAHDGITQGARPAGRGVVTVEGNRAVFRGKMFLDTIAGRETFAVLKEMGADQQWSFGFAILDDEAPSESEEKQGARRVLTKLDTFEVSPVWIAAGLGTRTLAVKQADGAGDEEDALATVVAAAVKSHMAERDAAETETKRLAAEAETQRAAAEQAELAAESDRLTATTKAIELAEAQRVVREAEVATKAAETARAEMARKAVDEFERFQRTMRKHA